MEDLSDAVVVVDMTDARLEVDWVGGLLNRDGGGGGGTRLTALSVGDIF